MCSNWASPHDEIHSLKERKEKKKRRKKIDPAIRAHSHKHLFSNTNFSIPAPPPSHHLGDLVNSKEA